MSQAQGSWRSCSCHGNHAWRRAHTADRAKPAKRRADGSPPGAPRELARRPSACVAAAASSMTCTRDRSRPPAIGAIERMQAQTTPHAQHRTPTSQADTQTIRAGSHMKQRAVDEVSEQGYGRPLPNKPRPASSSAVTRPLAFPSASTWRASCTSPADSRRNKRTRHYPERAACS